MITIPIHLEHAYKTVPRNKDLNLDVAHTCSFPSNTVVIDWQGQCIVCQCETWLPVSVGQIDDFATLSDIWTSPTARHLQQDIIKDKKFTYCAVDRCGVLDRDMHYPKHYISINIDESCNLRCPSCRWTGIMITEGPEFDIKLARAKHIANLLQNFQEPCHIIMSGNGDPLASAIMRPLIHSWQPRDNHTIRLFTNGLLMQKQLDGSPILDSITEYQISIDAGSAEVYEQVRLGGLWSQLLKNLDWLRMQVKKKPASVGLQFVLQQANYQDMNNFCELVIGYGFYGSITYLENWSTWLERIDHKVGRKDVFIDHFDEHDVIGNREHPEHAQAMDTLRRVYQRYRGQPISFGSKLVHLIHNT